MITHGSLRGKLFFLAQEPHRIQECFSRGGYIILTSSCSKVKFNLFIFLSVQFCVHSDKKKMLEELTNDIHQSPNKQKVLMELANCIASGRIC